MPFSLRLPNNMPRYLAATLLLTCLTFPLALHASPVLPTLTIPSTQPESAPAFGTPAATHTPLVFRSNQEAVAWYRQQAKQHNDIAALMAEVYSLFEAGKAANAGEVIALWQHSAEHDANAQYWYGLSQILAHDYPTAAAYLQKAAKQQHTQAMSALGRLYLFGLGVTPDPEQAAKWFQAAVAHGNHEADYWLCQLRDPGNGSRQANPELIACYEQDASQGDTRAMMRLAMLYREGWHVAMDYAAAERWYQQAAKHGDTTAAKAIDKLYFNRFGLSRDDLRQAGALQRQAKAGDVMAQLKVALMLDVGQGLAADPEQAVHWYLAAAQQARGQTLPTGTGLSDQSMALAQNRLGEILEWGRYGTQDVAAAARWYQQAAQLGNAQAQHNLGRLLEAGKGISMHYGEAEKWYRLAASQDLNDATNSLKTLYRNTYGLSREDILALPVHQRDAAQGNAVSQRLLGLMYESGKGLPVDIAQAVFWYGKAAAQGDVIAHYRLGNAYAEGKGLAVDWAQAARYYQLAASQGYAPAQNRLGNLYRYGQGMAQDAAEAARWYRLAAEQGLKEAQFSLGTLYLDGNGVPQSDSDADFWFTKAAAKRQ